MDEQNYGHVPPSYPPARHTPEPLAAPEPAAGHPQHAASATHAASAPGTEHLTAPTARSSYEPPTGWGYGADPMSQPSAPQAAAAPAVAGAFAAPRAQRPRRVWPAVAASAALAAVLASGGTALATGAFDRSTQATSYGALGATVPVAAAPAAAVDWQAIASQVRDGVVAISVVTSQGEGAGSGAVIDAENGYVVTNDHVVSGATNGGIQVTLADGRIYAATVVGTDPTTDIAVVRLTDPPSDLTAVPWGDSSQVLVGQDVMAVGNPLGLASTVTTGIVSAVDRPVSTQGETSTVVTNAIQIDAAINPGNSGGPLFSTAGEIIGINSSIATTSQTAGSIGLGFAIPSLQARSVAEQLIATGTAEHAYLGVTLSNGQASADGVTRTGAKVESVSSGTPAAAAGLKVGDVIVGINGKAVGGAESLTGFVRQFGAGDEATLTLVRAGEAQDVNVTLAVRDEAALQQQLTPEGADEGSGSGSGSGEFGAPDGGSQENRESDSGWGLLPNLPGAPWSNRG